MQTNSKPEITKTSNSLKIVASPEQLAAIQKETRKRLAAVKRQDRERKLANSLEWAR